MMLAPGPTRTSCTDSFRVPSIGGDAPLESIRSLTFGLDSTVVDEPWQLEGFSEQLDEWVELEQPEDWLRILVVNWVLGLINDPYQGLRRESGFDNLWFGVVPGSLNNDEAVCCSLWIDEAARRVRCDRIATLGWPIV